MRQAFTPACLIFHFGKMLPTGPYCGIIEEWSEIDLLFRLSRCYSVPLSAPRHC